MADFQTLLATLPELPFVSGLRLHALAYATVNGMHILCLGMFIGATFPMGLGILRAPGFGWARTVAVPLRRLAITAFLCTMLTGLLLFSVRPSDYLGNAAFLVKVSALLLAGANVLLFRRIYGQKVQAGLSLGLWLIALCAGRWIGFV